LSFPGAFPSSSIVIRRVSNRPIKKPSFFYSGLVFLSPNLHTEDRFAFLPVFPSMTSFPPVPGRLVRFSSFCSCKYVRVTPQTMRASRTYSLSAPFPVPERLFEAFFCADVPPCDCRTMFFGAPQWRLFWSSSTSSAFQGAPNVGTKRTAFFFRPQKTPGFVSGNFSRQLSR